MSTTGTHAVMPDGNRTRFSGGSTDVFTLRARCARPGYGVFFTLDIVIEVDGTCTVDADAGAEPDLSPVACASQVTRFPRDPEHVPAWLDKKLQQVGVITAPRTGFLDTPAEHLSVQDDYGEPDRSVIDEPDLEAYEIARRRALGQRVVEALDQRGIAAESLVVDAGDGDGDGGRELKTISVDLLDSPLDLSVLVDATSAFLVVNRDDDEDPDSPQRITHRDACTLIRHAHEAIQVALG